MNSNDDSAFLNSIKGVKPIIKKNTLEKKTPPKNTKYKNITNPKEKAKQTIKTLTKISKFSNFSIQKSNINKRLKKGKIPIDKKIDFHGLSVLDSEILFIKTIENCYNKNLRCVLFVTGKGILKKKDDIQTQTKLYYGKIRNNFMAWVERENMQKYILSVEQANMEQGSDGAFFVYLRKKKN
tara:strand:+ start:22 stop:567 length:546 start_codon:yes stop_codon:yes gene_type:complete